MIRPIRVAPLSNVRMISENPLVPNTMSNDQYLANQFASGNYAQPTAMATARPMPQQPVSPVQGLQQTAQQGLEGARTQQRTAQKLSQRVGGLLGGDEATGGLLGDIQGDAAIQGLFATMQAIGRPVRRGEDRYLGAVQYGQGVMQKAEQQGLQDLSTRMKLDEYQRAVAKAERDKADREKLQAFLMGSVPSATAQPAQALPEGTTGVLRPDAQQRVESNQRSPLDDALSSRYDAYEIGRLTDTEKQDAARAIRFEQAAQLAASMNRNDEAENYRKQAQAINDRIGAKFLSREKRTDLSYSRRDQWDKTEYRPRVEQVAKARQLVELAKNPSAISDISLIFGLMKSLDPRSTVREGEAAMVENAQGAFTRLLNIQQRIQEGRLLPDEAYPMIVEQALIVADAVEKDYQAAVDNRMGTLEEEGLKADIVIPYKKLNAPDVESTVNSLRQTLNLSPSAGTQGRGGSAIVNIVTGGRSASAR